jgi:hypothetical protein
MKLKKGISKVKAIGSSATRRGVDKVKGIYKRGVSAATNIAIGDKVISTANKVKKISGKLKKPPKIPSRKAKRGNIKKSASNLDPSDPNYKLKQLSQFIMRNPMFIAVMISFIIVFAYVAYMYATTDYRLKNVRLLGYMSDLKGQAREWCDNVSEHILTIMKWKHNVAYESVYEKLLLQDELRQEWSTIKDLVNEIIRTKGKQIKDISADLGDNKKFKMLKTGLSDKLHGLFVSLQSNDQLEEDTTRHALLKLVIAMSNQFGDYEGYVDNAIGKKVSTHITDTEYDVNMKYFMEKELNKGNMEGNHKKKFDPNEQIFNSNKFIKIDQNCAEYLNTTYLSYVDELEKANLETLYKELWLDVLKTLQSHFNNDFVINKNHTTEEGEQYVSRNIELLGEFFYGSDLVTSEENNTIFKNKYHLFDEIASDIDTVFIKHDMNDQINTKSGIYKFEELLYAFESEKGPGLLMTFRENAKRIDEMMKQFHYILLVNNFNLNKTRVNNAAEIMDKLESDPVKVQQCKDVVRSITFLQLHIVYEFPILLQYDTKRVSDVGRIRMFYSAKIESITKTIMTAFLLTIKIFGKGGCFIGRKIKIHKPVNNTFLNISIDLIHQFRTYLRSIAKKPGDFIGNIFKEGFVDGQSTEVEEGFGEPVCSDLNLNHNGDGATNGKVDGYDYTIKNGKVIEPLPGLKMLVAPFKFVAKLTKTMLKILTTITNPSKIIMVLINLIIALFGLLIAFLDSVHLITGTLATVAIVLYCIIYIFIMIVLLFVVVISQVLDLAFEGKIYTNLYSLLLSKENDIRNWYVLSAFEQGNKTTKDTILTCGPCGQDHIPSLMYCERKSKHVPSFSYHANIYKLANGLQIQGQSEIQHFKTNDVFSDKFHEANSRMQTKMIEASVNDINDYHLVSGQHMSKYENIRKCMCNDINSYDLSISDKDKMERLCHLSYCQNGAYAPFCSSITNGHNPFSHKMDVVQEYLNLTNYVLIITCVAICIYIGFNRKDLGSMIKRMYSETHYFNNIFSKLIDQGGIVNLKI